MLGRPVITLTTDFGLRDPFAGLMKGVILGIDPEANIIDITHGIERHNIIEASQVISMSYKYFPPGAINIAVVDPEVGSSRRPLLVITENHFFLGPDNGVFTPVYDEHCSGFLKVIHLTSSEYFLPMRGSTFHGRDIFAPVAARLSKGTDPYEFGVEIDDHKRIKIPGPALSNKRIKGEITAIDSFGNCISNIIREDMERLSPLTSGRKSAIIYRDRRLPLLNYYAESDGEGLAAVINSFGQVELFVYRGSAAEKYSIRKGDSISAELV